MAETIQNLITNTFGEHIIIATIIVALLPIFELRGAIPFATSFSIWGTNALSPVMAFVVSFCASLLIIPAIFYTFTPVLNALKKTRFFKQIATNLENKIKTKSNKISNNANTSTSNTKKNNLYKMLAVCIFVAVPLPLTGIYTGTAIAIMLGLNFKQALVACGVGNLIAGVIITLLCSLSENAGTYILVSFVIVLVLSVAYGIVKHLLRKKKRA